MCHLRHEGGPLPASKTVLSGTIVAIENPKQIAVLGAGPIGIEAALYARFLGYQVAIFERGSAAANVRRWGHVRMFSPFGMLRSPLGVAALEAQDPSYVAPGDDELLTGNEWIERYLEPLTKTDLLADSLHCDTRVLSLARQEFLKQDLPGGAERASSRFRILVEDSNGQRDFSADVVIDCTGVVANPNYLGRGGAPAVGELNCRDKIDYHVPDLLGSERQRVAGRRVLVIGNGHSAATSIVALGEVLKDNPETRVMWITRRAVDNGQGPVNTISDDALAERARLTQTANEIAAQGQVTLSPETSVETIHFDDANSTLRVTLGGQGAGDFEFDCVIANVGYRPDRQMYGELQVHECYASGGPMEVAKVLLQSPTVDCLDQVSHGPQVLVNPEADFYILGAKSYGRTENFLVSIGIEQVRDLFTIIGERSDLDLYESAVTLLEK